MSSISSSFGDLPSHKKTGVWWHNYPYNLYTQHLTPFAVLLLQHFSKYCMGLEHLPLFYHFKQTWWHHRSYSDHDCFSFKSEKILVFCFLLLPCGVIWFSILVSEKSFSCLEISNISSVIYDVCFIWCKKPIWNILKHDHPQFSKHGDQSPPPPISHVWRWANRQLQASPHYANYQKLKTH